jgi:hypothetical protein
VYPGDSFKSFNAHGITVYGTTDPALQQYLRNIRQQMRGEVLLMQRQP